MSKIYLVRHARYSNPMKISPGRLPVELSEDGIQQSEVLQKYFSDKNIDRIFCSPVLRCQQTAEIISDGNIPIQFDIRLAEVCSANQGNKEADNWRKELYWSVPTLGGESPQNVQDRMIDFWKTTNFDFDKNYVICSHGDPLFFLYQFLINQELHEDLCVNTPIEYQEKGSIRVVEYTHSDTIKVYSYISNQNL